MVKVTGLSGNEIYCLAKKGFTPGELVIGNSVNSMGFLGSFAASGGLILGGEIPQITGAIRAGRESALERMTSEARNEGAVGVAGVTSELRSFSGGTEFLFVGSCVHEGAKGQKFFTSAGDAQELYCHMDAGYDPIAHVFGNIAYSIGVGGSIVGSLKSLMRGEIREYTDVFTVTRHHALDRVIAQARQVGANAVVGIRTTILPWAGSHEMIMSGTACNNPALAEHNAEIPVSSDLTGEELWAMTALGYTPIKLLMSTSIYSLGAAGSFLAAFKSLKRGEISELSRMVHDARESAIDRLKSEADELGAEKVVGVKTFIAELRPGLVEFLAIGTAVKRKPNIDVKTAALPVQAIIRDRDTWIDGDFGFSLDRSE